MKIETDEITILIADDHPIFRKGLRQAIEESGLTVIAEADDGEGAYARILELRPRVAVLDVDMPRLDGFALARRLLDEKIEVEIVFLTMHRDEDIFNAALDLGARAYVVKDSAVTDIVASIRAVVAGEHFISPSVSTHLVGRSRRADALRRERPGLDTLTPTERRVLRLIAENKTSKEIAASLFISYRTIETHRANIAAKLDLHGSHALLKFALEHKSELA
jgi:DNA-binding NarL/FixJ family response regulator